MKTLLPAIKTAIQGLSLLVSTSNAFITPHVGWRPEGTGSTCIGIHDAGTIRAELAGNMIEQVSTVDIAAFVPLGADAKDAITGASGAFALLDAATDILKRNRLSISEVQSVEIGKDSQSELYQASESLWLVRICRQFIYTLERSS